MPSTNSYTAETNHGAHVRRNTGSAAIAAFLMLAYALGFLTPPDPTDLFTWCNFFFYYTLLIGGTAYALIAVWSWIGHAAALAADGVLSLIVGVLFMITGIGMWSDGGGAFQNALIVVFGWLFSGVGVRNLRTFQYLTSDRAESSVAGVARSEHAMGDPSPDEPIHPSEFIAGRWRAQRESDQPQLDEREITEAPTPQKPREDLEPGNQYLPPDDDEPVEAPAGGFLANLARKGRPPGV